VTDFALAFALACIVLAALQQCQPFRSAWSCRRGGRGQLPRPGVRFQVSALPASWRAFWTLI